ncbi:Ser-Thr-rich glycosyl-phosphatidyl-inositol-anchored membrane family-domain-containing protein [Cercophora scortea]|uniref:Ser-Thr-rich glycosyl-phosphatidyl-inositol-anchored membrane family-domain-containing protein n=1 Tax=Cercophora scortea TaxID=314031 RepID=A0AAE0MMA9_9PEZI|nr:Ser-Thr-rich glycosyl-phosphatidyl-inositol-anchored membrane family-domain-containing protein [Cercophora scortea]
MRYSIAAVVAFASVALAQSIEGFDAILKPTKGDSVPAGKTYEIKWETSELYPGTVTIDLLGGPSEGLLDVVETIGKHVDNTKGSFSWAVDKKLGALKVYGLQITYDKNTTLLQWSFPFPITGGSAVESSSISASASASASAFASKSSTSSVTVPTLSSSTIITSTLSNNISTTASPTETPSATLSFTSSTPSKTTTSASVVPTAGAATVVAGSLSVFGGLAMALFAL